ncbi:myotubularin-related protein 5/13 [Pelomyxa schiedti]|nr:myotubularin-related protein 5/13 [Pelomyxa schiedti]
MGDLEYDVLSLLQDEDVVPQSAPVPAPLQPSPATQPREAQIPTPTPANQNQPPSSSISTSFSGLSPSPCFSPSVTACNSAAANGASPSQTHNCSLTPPLGDHQGSESPAPTVPETLNSNSQQRLVDYFLVIKPTKERFISDVQAPPCTDKKTPSVKPVSTSVPIKGGPVRAYVDTANNSLWSSSSPQINHLPRETPTRSSALMTESQSSLLSSATSSALSCSPPLQHEREIMSTRVRSFSVASTPAELLSVAPTETEYESEPNVVDSESNLGPFKAEIVDRIPSKDYLKSPVPPFIWMLCFPNGASLAMEPQAPKFFTFVVTEVDGSRYFGSALVVYQPNEADIELDELLGDSPVEILFSPVCLCILSRYAFYSTFKQFLVATYKVSRMVFNVNIVSNFIHQLVESVPLPPEGYMLRISLLGNTCDIKRPKLDDFPLVEVPFRYLFDCIGIEAVISLVVAVLEEKRILFLSSLHGLLTIACETLISLLYPFRHLHVYIPTLNSSLHDYLQAPTPYIIGMTTQGNIDSVLEELSDVIIVNLDTGHVTHKDCPGSPVTKSSLSPEPARILAHKIRAVLYPHIANLDNAFDTDSVPSWVLGTRSTGKKVSEDVQIRLVWLDFFVSMLYQFRYNLRILRKYPKPVYSFDKSQFIRAQPSPLQDFAKTIVDTPAFTDMMDTHILHNRSMFDLAIFHYSQHHSLEQLMYQAETPPVITLDIEQLSIEPCDTGQYNAFPILQPLIPSDQRSPLKTVPAFSPLMEVTPANYFQDFAFMERDEMMPNFQKNKALVEPYIKTLFLPDQTKVREQAPFSVLNGSISGVLAFTSVLVSYTQMHQQKHNDLRLSNSEFDVLSTLLLMCLSVSTNSSDFRAPAHLVGIVTAFYHKVDSAQECLAYRLGNAPIWKSEEFWDFYFAYKVHDSRSTLDVTYNNHINDWNTFSSTTQLLISQKEEDVIMHTLGSLIFLMLSLGVDATTTKSFVNKVVDQCSLQSDKHDQMLVLIKNLAKAHEESITQLQAIKSKMKKFDAPPPGKSKDDSSKLPIKQPPLMPPPTSIPDKEGMGLGVIGPEKKDGFNITTLQGGIGPISCTSMHGPILLSGSTLGPVSLWDTESLQFISKLTGHTAEVSSVHFGSNIVSSSYDSTLRVWDPSNHKCITELKGHTGPIYSSLLHRSSAIISGGADRLVRLWDTRVANSVSSLIGHRGPIRTLTDSTLDAPSSIIVSAGEDNIIKVWDLKKMDCLYTLEGHTNFITQVLFDSKTIISASYDCTLKCWDMKDSGRCTRSLVGHQGSVNCFAIDKSSSKIVSGSGDNMIRVWDHDSANCCAVLRGHSAEVTCLACVDGWVVSGSEDKTVRMWTLNGDCVKLLRGHDDSLTSIYAQSKLRIISTSRDSTARIWSITPPQPPTTTGSTFVLGHRKYAASVDNSHFSQLKSSSPVNTKMSIPLKPAAPAPTPTKSGLPMMLHHRTLSGDSTKSSGPSPFHTTPIIITPSQSVQAPTPSVTISTADSTPSPTPSPTSSPTLPPIPPPSQLPSGSQFLSPSAAHIMPPAAAPSLDSPQQQHQQHQQQLLPPLPLLPSSTSGTNLTTTNAVTPPPSTQTLTPPTSLSGSSSFFSKFTKKKQPAPPSTPSHTTTAHTPTYTHTPPDSTPIKQQPQHTPSESQPLQPESTITVVPNVQQQIPHSDSPITTTATPPIQHSHRRQQPQHPLPPTPQRTDSTSPTPADKDNNREATTLLAGMSQLITPPTVRKAAGGQKS